MLDRWRSTPPRNCLQDELSQKSGPNNIQNNNHPMLISEFKIGGNASVPQTRAENPDGKKV